MSGYIIHPKFCCSTDKLGRKRERETILKPENVNAMQKPNCGTYSSYKMANLDRNGSSFLYLQVYTHNVSRYLLNSVGSNPVSWFKGFGVLVEFVVWFWQMNLLARFVVGNQIEISSLDWIELNGSEFVNFGSDQHYIPKKQMGEKGRHCFFNYLCCQARDRQTR